MAGGRLAARLQTLRTLWLGLLGSHVVMYGMLAGHVVRSEPQSMPPHLPEIFAALSLGIAIMSIVLPARTFDLGLRNLDVPTTNELGEPVGSFRESAPARKVVANPEGAVFDALARFQSPFIVGLALAESISLFGFTIGFFGAPAMTWTPFFAAGITLTLFKFPRVSTITRAIERVKGARCDLKL